MGDTLPSAFPRREGAHETACLEAFVALCACGWWGAARRHARFRFGFGARAKGKSRVRASGARNEARPSARSASTSGGPSSSRCDHGRTTGCGALGVFRRARASRTGRRTGTRARPRGPDRPESGTGPAPFRFWRRSAPARLERQGGGSDARTRPGVLCGGGARGRRGARRGRGPAWRVFGERAAGRFGRGGTDDVRRGSREPRARAGERIVARAVGAPADLPLKAPSRNRGAPQRLV